MDYGHLRPEQATTPPFGVTPPATELLLDPGRVGNVWPKEADDTEFMANLEARAGQARSITETLDELPPGVPMADALEARLITEDQASGFYDALSRLLQDTDNKRLALYLPLELLPDNRWHPEHDALRSSLQQCAASYRTAWYSLLGAHDVRANFVDGDVLETEHRTQDVPRVVKAAHLMPALYERGLLSADELWSIAEHEGDPVLHHSAAEALAALHSITYGTPGHQEDTLPMTERRKAWLAEQALEAEITAEAARLQASLVHHTVPEGLELRSTMQQQAYIVGVYNAVTATAQRDHAAATRIYTQQAATLHTLWEQGDMAVRERLAGVFRRLKRLGIVDAERLQKYSIATPELGAPLSEHLTDMQAEVTQLRDITERIATDPYLSRMVYPVAILGGSRFKGYGGLQSDTDVSVCIRPEVPQSEREALRSVLARTFTAGETTYEPMEFWLQTTESGGLHVRDDAPDAHMADKYWTHLLFNGAWIGDEQAIDELQQRLLPAYFSSTDQDREFYIQRLEQDLLQYRLMHKGYARHYPLLSRSEASRHPAIDGESVFWDPGYRQIATRLFAQHVYLPKITE